MAHARQPATHRGGQRAGRLPDDGVHQTHLLLLDGRGHAIRVEQVRGEVIESDVDLLAWGHSQQPGAVYGAALRLRGHQAGDVAMLGGDFCGAIAAFGFALQDCTKNRNIWS